MSHMVRVLKYDADSPTDKALQEVQKKLHAGSSSEAFRRSVAIAKFITDARADGKIIYVEDAEGNKQRLEIA